MTSLDEFDLCDIAPGCVCAEPWAGERDECAYCGCGIVAAAPPPPPGTGVDAWLFLCPDCLRTVRRDCDSRLCGACWRPLEPTTLRHVDLPPAARKQGSV